MSNDHEYSLLGGINRTQVGHALAVIAAAVSGGIVYLLLRLVDLARHFGLNVNLPPEVLSLVGAGSVYGVLYWYLNRRAWRWSRLGSLLKLPDISGDWDCVGQTLDLNGQVLHNWQGRIKIVQSWNKLRVLLSTHQSSSTSIAAAIVCDKDGGYRLLYNYKNDPGIGEVQLRSHRGSADIGFSQDLRSAKGEYFNGYGRYTFGTLQLTRK